MPLVLVLSCALTPAFLPGASPAAVQGDSSRAESGVPLGGIGTGGMELRPDGLFHSWNLFNNVPWAGGGSPEAAADHLPPPPAFLPLDACFGVRILGAEPPPVTRLLFLGGDSDRGLPSEALTAADRLYLFPWFETVRSIEYAGRYPIARLIYRDPALPCRIELEAITPFIPHNPDDSGIPGCIFRFRIENPTDETLAVSIFFSLINGAGYDLPDRRMEHVAYREADRLDLVMGLREPPPSPASGQLALAGLGSATTVKAGWSDPWEFFQDFRDDGMLSGPDRFQSDPSLESDTDRRHGAVCDRLILSPGKTDSTTFLMAWHFPHHLDLARADVGKRYAGRFADVRQVIDYLATELDRLLADTREFTATLYGATIPEDIADAVGASLGAFSRSTVWTGGGDYGMWEGLGGRGCNFVDVAWYGSWPQLVLFPELEKGVMRRAGEYPDEGGRVGRYFPGTFRRAEDYGRADVPLQFALQVCRDYIWTADTDFINALWPAVQSALDYAAALDTDGNGLPNLNRGGLTFDGKEFSGDTVYLGTLYLAALTAALETAGKLGDARSARRYERDLRAAQTAFDSYLWNQEIGYYVLSYDLTSGHRDSGCLADQLSGQWFADRLGLGDLSNGRRIDMALRTIHRLNRRPGEGLANCVYPGGPAADRPIDRRWDLPWTGVEFAAAALMIGRGLVDQGLEIASEAYRRHRRAGFAWNLTERFPYHQRPMSVWTVLLALEGFAYDAVDARMTFDPVYRPDDFSGPLIVPSAWGDFEQVRRDGRQHNRITLTQGRLALASLTLGLPGAHQVGRVSAAVDDRPVAVRHQQQSDNGSPRITILFPEGFALTAGDNLTIELD